MELINFWIHTNHSACNTNNCYHEYNTNYLFVSLFGFVWTACSWKHNTVSFHEHNERKIFNVK